MKTMVHPHTALEEKMNTSPLLSFFSQVELDSEVDLYLFKTFEKEVALFWQTIPLQPHIRTPHSIHFLRINSRSLQGCYRPASQSVVIDIRCGHSLVHEMGHVLDFEMGSNRSPLSERQDDAFRPLYTAYTRRFAQSATEQASYYLLPTEVFARCFEMYVAGKMTLTKIGYNTDEFGIAAPKGVYPLDLLPACTAYFDALLTV